MKIDLHCNLPYPSHIPNTALGYLKGFLSNHQDLQVRNIYWNLLPRELHETYTKLVEEGNKFYVGLLVYSYIGRFLFDKNPEFSLDSLSNPIFESPFFPNYMNRFKDFAEAFKSHVDKTVEEKALHQVDVAGFTMSMHQWLFNYYIIQKLKQKNPHIRIIIGGIPSRPQAIEYLRVFKEADVALWGEGEIPFVRLLSQLNNASSYKDVPNLVYRQNEKILSTQQLNPKELPSIDSYPFADHTDYVKTLKEYNYEIPFVIPILGTRSCAWAACKFCTYNEGTFYRERSPENIVKEIEYQSQKYGTDDIFFVDNDFGRKNKKDFHDLLTCLVQSSEHRKKPYRIQAMLSASKFDRDLLELMRKIAVVRVEIGFEALTDSLLKKMLKPQHFAHNIQALKLAEEFDLLLRNLVIMGIPSEQPEDIVESINNLKFFRFFLKKYTLSPLNFKLYKYAPFYNDVLDDEREKQWNYNREWSVIHSLDFLSSVDKREFFGFSSGLANSILWENFRMMLEHYQSEKFSYHWFAYPDGSSVVEEYGKDILDQRCKYLLNPIETKILTFCDTVKKYSDIVEHIPELEPIRLREILLPLKNAGLLYVDNNFTEHAISVLSNRNKITV